MKKVNGKSVRDYAREESLYEKKHPERDAARAQRNRARALVKKKLGATAIKGKDIGHKKAVSKGGRNGLSNLFVQDAGQNRSFSRNKDGSMKSERSKRETKKR